MNRRTRGRITLLASAAILGLVVLVFVGPRLIVHDDGPVPTTDPAGLEYEYAGGEATTWGITLPPSGAQGPARLESVETQGVTGLDILGIGVCDNTQPNCAVANAVGWPPSGPSLLSPRGLQLEPASPGSPVYQLLIGVRRPSSEPVGVIESIKLVYSVGDTRYQVIEPWSLRIYAPGTMPQ